MVPLRMRLTIAMPLLLRGSLVSLSRAHTARFILVAIIACFASAFTQRATAAASLWTEVIEPELDATNHWVHPARAKVFQLTSSILQEQLASVPREFSPAAQGSGTITLPMPDGSLVRFRIWESHMMEPELAGKFPEIKTYAGQGIDDPSATVRLDWTPAGLHAQILAPSGAVYIDPHRSGDSRRHVSYFKRDYRRKAASFRCLTQDEGALHFQPAAVITPAASGTTLRTYRLAVAATGEYTQFHGGTVAAGLAAIVTAINRVNGIFESELAIRLVLVANNDRLVFTNATTDPYSNTDLNAMLGQNQTTIDNLIGNTNYDVGHVFCTADGGLTGSTGTACFDGVKARSVTGQPSPTGDPYYIDYVAHEIGHEFGAAHSFNGTGGICNGQRTPGQAYEPGSGSTLMSYAGICSADDLQPHSDPYFHTGSYDAIQFYVTVGFGKDCPVSTPTGNNPPIVSVGAVTNFNIPRGTPFTLTATGSDPDGDPLTYCWEERDLGPAQTLSSGDNGSSPLFRSYAPTTNNSRTFPTLTNLLNNITNLGEKLPTTSRTNKFRVTARDNRAGGGGVNAANMLVTVSAAAGPFVVTSPNTAVTWSGQRAVTWNVAGTTAAPINATNVNILLSTDGGFTFPIVVATNTPNDGSEIITLPPIPTTTARIKVQPVGNIFFDLSDANFTIAPPVVSIAATDTDAAETGLDAGVFRVSRTGPTTNNLIVSYSISGTATSGADFTPLSGSVTIPTGSPSATITVMPVDDFLAEPGETVILTLVTSAAYAINATSNNASVTILDNDVATLSIADTSVIEGNSGAISALFNVTLSPPSSQLVSVNYSTASASALASLDFMATNSLLQFSPGQTNHNIAVAVLGDLLLEGNEHFNVQLSNPVGATLARTNALGTIVDDEIRIVISTGAGSQLQFNTVAGRNYQIEWTQDLPATNGWSILPGAASLPGSGGLLQITDTNAPSQPQRFYRISDLNGN
jgi:Metallo-peptidase family M12B Reprolysin-like/Calx-beta domain